LRGDVKLFHSGYDMVEQITPQEVRHARARTLVNPVELSCRLFKLTRLCVEVSALPKSIESGKISLKRAAIR
jgi:hypothetical protein